MTSAVGELLGTIGAIQTLIENFPMSILTEYRGKQYTSTIEFVIDVLRQIGISEEDILNEIIKLIFDVPNAVELYRGIGDYQYKLIKKPTDEQKTQAVILDMPSTIGEDDPLYIAVNPREDEIGNIIYDYYQKKAPYISDEQNSAFLKDLETSLKSIIANMLTGILSCSIDPRLPYEYMDDDRGMNIPLSLLDGYNLLSISPTNEIGKNFYNVEDDIFSTDLYKSYDLNAFIWYVLNRGSRVPQSEKNKMMWDSRILSKEMEEEVRDTPESWNYWYNSKTTDTDCFMASGATKVASIESPLHPILQLMPHSSVMDGSGTLKVYFPKQTYISGETRMNIYQFNTDYLNNIRIFSPRVILANMIEEVLNGNLLGNLHLNFGSKMQMFEKKLNNYIKTAIEVDDTNVSDCFYSFSNADYDEMVRENELKRYGAIELGSETSPAMSVNANYGIDAINEINSMATSNEKISTISKTLYEISTIPSQDESVANNTQNGVISNTEFINRIIMALIRPIIRSVITPQVMMLFIINFDVMGMINLEDPIIGNKIEDILFKKLMTVFITLIQKVKDAIIEFLMKLFYKSIEPLIVLFCARILLEQLNDWIRLLEEAIKCLPGFIITRNYATGGIDDVNYADITKTQDIPEIDSGCN